ncbi:hypothetical protein POTOM_056371 [Populus tomentosa]|uniref:Uncharacterized protein n=1 Tax=Populus tomentosa TaxID=118781 RepID=A0A8X8C4U4_POPTO|nr:hypothetical protein POTOM_056371 [Populus tomentosa]
MEKKRRSWACTFVLQVSLLIAFYLALNLGQPQMSIFQNRNGTSSSRRPLDVYFLSVRGGYRPLKQQNLLLKQILLLMKMEKVASFYRARFVVNISELGEDDPLKQNASRLFPPQKVPWYSTKVSNDGKVVCFLEHVNITSGKMLTVVGLDTGSFQIFVALLRACLVNFVTNDWFNRGLGKLHLINEVHGKAESENRSYRVTDYVDIFEVGFKVEVETWPILNFKDSMLMGSTSDFKNRQLNWLAQSLEATTDNWIIVSGFHPVVICDKEQLEAKQINGPLHNIFMKHGVDVYVSSQGCTSRTVQDGVAHIGIADPTDREPLVNLNGRLAIQKEMINDGFLLHRVSSLEITTYFVSSAGEIVNEAVITQHELGFLGVNFIVFKLASNILAILDRQMGKVGARLSWRGDPDGFKGGLEESVLLYYLAVLRWEIEIGIN